MKNKHFLFTYHYFREFFIHLLLEAGIAGPAVRIGRTQRVRRVSLDVCTCRILIVTTVMSGRITKTAISLDIRVLYS